tara:strand:+ start:1812 stop:4016 length:2205 start_codon:yes stop_codon:yes gene_type:complete
VNTGCVQLKRFAVSTLAVVCTIVLSPFTVPAQEETSSTNNVITGVELSEVVIMGQKEHRGFSKTSSSVGVIDSQRSEDFRIYSVGDALRQIANVRAPQFSDGGFVIRGVNTEAPDAENASGNQAPLATVYVDGVALTQGGSRRGPLGMWDIDQVEVFRGPQSTVQGRNSLAGAIHIHTKDPTFYWEGASRTTVGSQNSLDQALMLSGPLNNDFAFRIATEANRTDSQIDYPLLQAQPSVGELERADSWSLRFKLLYAPENNETFDGLLSYNHAFGRPSQNEAFGPNAPFPGANPNLSFFDREWRFALGTQQYREANSDLVSQEFNWRPGGAWRFFSQSSFSRTETDVKTVAASLLREDVEAELTQEFRAHYEAEKTRGVAGAYGNFAFLDSTQNGIERNRINLALFGEADHEFRPGWHAIVGLRLDSDDFEISSQAAPTAAAYNLRLLPKSALRHEFNESHSATITVQQGYRSGGAGINAANEVFNFDPSTTWNYEIGLRSKWLDGRLETGVNTFFTQWSDQQVVLREVDAGFVPSERVVNASESELAGIELESRFRVTEELSVFASAAYLTTSYKDFTLSLDLPPAIPASIPRTLDYSGYDFPESPRFTGSIGANYDHKSGFFAAVDAEASSSYYSPYLFAPSTVTGIAASIQVPQNQLVEISARVLLNATVGWKWKRTTVTLFARNLLDRDYLIGKLPGATGLGATGVTFNDGFLATVGPPRFLGAALDVRF